jgi:hypothetical protein
MDSSALCRSSMLTEARVLKLTFAVVDSGPVTPSE